MNIRSFTFSVFASFAISISVHGQRTATAVRDSIELRNLIIRVLKWSTVESKGKGDLGDFQPKDPKAPDSVYRSVDWSRHKMRVSQLEKTGYFTSGFLTNYDSIAKYLDKELKRNKEKYIVGYLPPYDHASEWCDCQDYPTNPWKKFHINNLKSDGRVASFSWTWMKGQRYKVRARKIGESWRVDWLEKFTVDNFKW